MNILINASDSVCKVSVHTLCFQVMDFIVTPVIILSAWYIKLRFIHNMLTE